MAKSNSKIKKNKEKINKLKEQLVKLRLELKKEKENRLNCKDKQDLLIQCIEKEDRINIQIMEIQDEILELEKLIKQEYNLGNNKGSRNKKTKYGLDKYIKKDIDDYNKNHMENHAIILDYLPYGYPKSKISEFRNKPIAQAIGTANFTLLELAPKIGVDLEIQEVVYIGKGKRDKIYRVLGKIDSDKLTSRSCKEIDYVINKLVEATEEKYVDFFNESGGLTLNLHQLGLLPGISGSTVNNILRERKIRKFSSFSDIKNRVRAVKNPKKNVADKIKEELKLLHPKNKLDIYLLKDQNNLFSINYHNKHNLIILY